MSMFFPTISTSARETSTHEACHPTVLEITDVSGWSRRAFEDYVIGCRKVDDDRIQSSLRHQVDDGIEPVLLGKNGRWLLRGRASAAFLKRLEEGSRKRLIEFDHARQLFDQGLLMGPDLCSIFCDWQGCPVDFTKADLSDELDSIACDLRARLCNTLPGWEESWEFYLEHEEFWGFRTLRNVVETATALGECFNSHATARLGTELFNSLDAATGANSTVTMLSPDMTLVKMGLGFPSHGSLFVDAARIYNPWHQAGLRLGSGRYPRMREDSAHFLAPELISHVCHNGESSKSGYPPAARLWSLGTLLTYVRAGHVPNDSVRLVGEQAYLKCGPISLENALEEVGLSWDDGDGVLARVIEDLTHPVPQWRPRLIAVHNKLADIADGENAHVSSHKRLVPSVPIYGQAYIVLGDSECGTRTEGEQRLQEQSAFCSRQLPASPDIDLFVFSSDESCMHMSQICVDGKMRDVRKSGDAVDVHRFLEAGRELGHMGWKRLLSRRLWGNARYLCIQGGLRLDGVRGLFERCAHLRRVYGLEKANTHHVESLSHLFDGCVSLSSADLGHLDTSHVLSMAYMFRDCRSIRELDLTGVNTENVITMRSMFYGCLSLETLTLFGIETARVKDMWQMFALCGSLRTLDASEFDTRRVEDMGHIFDCCESLGIESRLLERFLKAGGKAAEVYRRKPNVFLDPHMEERQEATI